MKAGVYASGYGLNFPPLVHLLLPCFEHIYCPPMRPIFRGLLIRLPLPASMQLPLIPLAMLESPILLL